MITLIAAASENNVIGNNGEIPWHLPDDLKHFRDATKEKTVIMGRKTYQSIGRPLPKRQNIVVTRDTAFTADGCDVVHSLDDAFVAAQSDDVYVIGGGELYNAALDRADRIDFTRVHTEVDGDAFFPKIDAEIWKEISREEHPADDDHAYPFTFLLYERK